MAKPTERVLVIPDLHAPFMHRDAVPFLRAVARRYKPTRVVCLGDEVDFHALSEHDHDPSGYSAGDELEAAIAHLRPIYDLFPEVAVCVSNHTSRPYRKALKSGIPVQFLREYREFLRAPKGWSWHDRVEVDGVNHEHGQGLSGRGGALRLALARMRSTWIGHLHAHAGIQWSANSLHLVFAGNAGWLGDEHAYAMRYGKFSVDRGALGVGFTDRGVPLWLPMMLARGGRWTGRLP